MRKCRSQPARIVASLAFLSVPLMLPATLPAQTRTEIVRGRVTSDSGAPIGGALVHVTMGPARLTRRTSTDSTGVYEVVFAQGTGDYLVHVAAPGWQSFRKRVLAAEASPDTVFTVDATLAPDVTRLAAVTVKAERLTPSRDPDIGDAAGAVEHSFEGVTAAVSPQDEGELAAIAATTPGVSIAAGRPTAPGLDPAQNTVTLNGLAFPGTALPRDARTRTRISTSTYDPARGGFGALQMNVEMAPGGDFTFRRSHLTLDAPALQPVDGAAGGLGQRVTSARASIGGDGDVLSGRWFYNTGLQASRETTDAVSLFDAGSARWRRNGVNPDSVRRLYAVLGTLGVPTTAPGAPSSRATDEASLLLRLDHTPTAPRAFAVTIFGQYARSGALGMGPTVAFARGGQSRVGVAGIQAQYSVFADSQKYLNETRSAFSSTSHASDSYLSIPGANVLVASTPDAANAGGLATLQVGGGEAGTRDRSWTWETINETQWYPASNSHRLKLTGESRLDGTLGSSARRPSGTFLFNSIADVEAGRPSAYVRQPKLADVGAIGWSGFAALGDLWRKSPTLQVLYGARLEGNRFLAAPARDAGVEGVFGVRTDRVPDGWHVSPRLGFTWSYGDALENGGTRSSALGTFFPGPMGVFRGGVGEFRSLVVPALIADAIAAEPGRQRATEVCVGPDVPLPEWSAYVADGAAPPSCEGTLGSPYAETAPSTVLFDPSYTAPRSWRGNLGWSAVVWRIGVNVDAVYSLNVDQPSAIDLNFRNEPRFTLRDEADRPVFVPPSSIVPAAGALSPAAARVTRAYGRVESRRSDLRSRSAQLSVVLSPQFANWGRTYLNLAYTWGQTQALERGTDDATFTSPLTREWAPSAWDVRHQILVQAGRLLPANASLTLFARFTSGLPFTPVAGADVNGDGLANDRAFVFDPHATADSALAAQMQGLFAGARGPTRECLMRQRGRPAGRNSCRTTWSAALNARLAFSSEQVGRVLGTGQRATVAFAFSNPLGGLDQLMHGRGRTRGWGTPSVPDPVLYTVRGFDPQQQRFSYTINPHFGAARVDGDAVPTPFRITLDISFDLSEPFDEQMLGHALDPGRRRPGIRRPTETLLEEYRRTVPSVYAAVLEQSDSLMLSREQTETLTRSAAAYQQRADSVWRPLAEYLASLDASYDAGDAIKRVQLATDRVWDIAQEQGPVLKAILSPLQLGMLSGLVADVVYTKGKIKVRYYGS